MGGRNIQFKPRFFVLLGLLVTVVVVGVLVLTGNRRAGECKAGSMQLSLPVRSVLIRDERSISTEKYDRVRYAVTEGARVESDALIATVYRWGYSDDMNQSLASIRAQIYDAQMEVLAGIEYPELTVLDLSIAQKEAAIRDCAMDGTGCMLTLEGELRTLTTERATYLKDTVQPNETLNALYTSEADKLAQIAAYETEVRCTGSGVVSFYFDGYEDVFNAGKLDTVNVELVNAAIKGGAGATTSESETRLYRLINDAHWYVAFVTPLTDPLRLVAGERYTVTFTGYEENVYAGTALAPIKGDAGVLNLIECNVPIDALISARTAEATVRLDAEGLQAPLAAVTLKDGVAGVTVRQGGENVRVEVDVLATDAETAIIRPRESTALIEGMEYVM